MNFNANFYSLVSCLADMGIFSGLLTVAVSNNMSIQQTQTMDTLEQWGVCHPNHDYCYGRHLYYRSKNVGLIPFWIGLDIVKNSTSVTIAFERATLNVHSLVSNVANLSPAVHSVFPGHCNPQSSFFIERQLEPTEFSNLCGNHDPKILSDFINEVLAVL